MTFEGLPIDSMDTAAFYESVVGRNCENVVGFVPLPVGVVGPLMLDGKSYTVPLATTEGALVASTNRGARAISAAGGATSALLAEGMTRAPLVSCVDLAQAAALKSYCESEQGDAETKEIFSQTTRFGKLLGVKVAVAGRHAYLRFKCATGDAMGMNMVGKGVNQVSLRPGRDASAAAGLRQEEIPRAPRHGCPLGAPKRHPRRMSHHPCTPRCFPAAALVPSCPHANLLMQTSTASTAPRSSASCSNASRARS